MTLSHIKKMGYSGSCSGPRERIHKVKSSPEINNKDLELGVSPEAGGVICLPKLISYFNKPAKFHYQYS